MVEFYFLYVTLPLICGFILDMLFGDPRRFTHPVVRIGGLISFFDKVKYGNLLDEEGRDDAKRKAGMVTAAAVVSAALAAALLIPSAAAAAGYAGGWVAEMIAGHAAAPSGEPALLSQDAPFIACGMAFEDMPHAAALAVCIAVLSIMCWQMLAARSLYSESMKVYHALKSDDPDNSEETENARYAVSMIVGRDTSVLDRTGIIKAAVETVAENTSDGVTAPVFWMTILGVPGIYIYKAVNTMDSMIGYKNDRYMHFGRFAALADDVLNYLPSRITALFMCAAAFILPGFSGRDAFRIWRRDCRKHASPNSAQTESACAGALRIRLAGPAVYFGKRQEKPYIGDDVRPVEREDIRRANILMLVTSLLMTAASAAGGLAAVFFASAILF